ncbi:hypothetical protein TrLO_g8986 [Triparma laevis f. longispina]|uniref:Trigger factor ribosome-binding bacterial domain-containing protein n=1 Tax=Triparma laevis f. longispina TaxID=1714387 RepID=A0A9W7AX22_9STRA|nr:hypothetical protein TrLO_g8986 [Triparma laevis f. longispina]
MQTFACFLLALLSLATNGTAYHAGAFNLARRRPSALCARPPAGETLPPIVTDPSTTSIVKTGDTTYWLSHSCTGPEILNTKKQVIKESAKNANFPGFRKGQIPPWAMPKMSTFAIQECITSSLNELLKGHDLEAKDGKVEVVEDVQEIGKNWKEGDDVHFTAEFEIE